MLGFRLKRRRSFPSSFPCGDSMLYYFLKGLLRPALRVFYRQTAVEGRAGLPEAGPLLVVANHPNTLMDPLLVGMLWRRQLRFLTSSRFFVGFGGWVLRAAGAIPLYRQEDTTADDTTGARAGTRLTGVQRSARNEASFRATFELLKAGESLLIFPEGSSVLTRRLRPFKSGAARIALGAEARHDWQLGLQIIPVGLDYAAADHFRTRLSRRIGPPIQVATYRAAYEANPSAAIRALTEAVRGALTAQLLVTRSPADEAVLRALPALLPDLRAPLTRLSSPHDADFHLSQSLLHALTQLDARAPYHSHTLRRRLTTYQRARQQLRLTAETSWQPISAVSAVLMGVLGSPVWLWGMLNNAAAYALPTTLARRLTTETEFRASIIMVTGMLSVLLCYGAQTWLVWRLTQSAALAGAYLVALPVTGAFALAFQRRLTQWGSQFRLRRLARKRPRLLAALRAEHAALVEELRGVLGAGYSV